MPRSRHGTPARRAACVQVPTMLRGTATAPCTSKQAIANAGPRDCRQGTHLSWCRSFPLQGRSTRNAYMRQIKSGGKLAQSPDSPVRPITPKAEELL